MVRLDFDAAAAGRLADAQTLLAVLAGTFGLRRKKIATAARSRAFPFPTERFLAALAEAGIDPSRRPHQIPPAGFLAAANILSRSNGPGQCGTMQT
jgi:hypothetical protein